MSLMCRSFRSTCFGATQVLDNVDQARPSVGQTAEISSAPGASFKTRYARGQEYKKNSERLARAFTAHQCLHVQILMQSC